MTNKISPESLDFYGLGIAPKLLKILEQLKFTTPTPIQFKSIPVTIEGKDIVGIAQTGTGKTLAFGIPMLQRLAQHKGRGLVILPTRELAIQVDENLKMIGQKIGLRTAVLIGGESKGMQLSLLRRNPHIIIATPGRLIDHLEHRSINLKDIKILVLDEADMMFSMGFEPQITKILNTIPKVRQTMLFSATMPPAVMKIITKHMALPVRIEVAPSGTPAENVIQEMIIVRNDDKFSQLNKIINEYSGSILIFVRTKHSVKNLCQKIKMTGQKVNEIHSNRSPIQRREALGGFKNGRYRILVATDIAARGIDVKEIELVINYDLPDDVHDYVHRIGRTGRAGKPGHAISFVSPHQIREIANIERLIKKNITVKNRATGININEKRPIKNSRPVSRFGYKKNVEKDHVKSTGNNDKKPYKKFYSKDKPFSKSNRPLTDKQKFRRSISKRGKY